MIKRKTKIIESSLSDAFEAGSYVDPTPIDDIINALTAFKNKGYTLVTIDGNCDYDRVLEQIEFTPCETELEPLDKYNERVRVDKERIDRINRIEGEIKERQDKADYERLKAMYDPKE